MPSTRTGPATRTALCLSLLLAFLLVLSLTGCVAEAEPESGSSAKGSSATAALTATPVATEVEMGQVVGRLPRQRRKHVRRQIAAVVDGWWEAAYLGGEFPRKAFPSAFPGFTRGAEARARGQKALMSNRAIGPRVTSVVPLKRRVTLDVVAVDGAARAVTARFVLRFRTTGDREGVDVVRGRLFLTRHKGTWKVFGFDVARGERS